MGTTPEPTAEVSKDKNSITITRKQLVAGVAALSLAIVAGAGVALTRGGNDRVAAAPVETTTGELPVDETVNMPTETEPVEAAPTEPTEVPVVNEVNPNPLGLVDRRHSEVMAFGNPIDILRGSETDTMEDITEKFSKALMVWINTDNEGRRDEYAQVLFGDTNRIAKLHHEDIFPPENLGSFHDAREAFLGASPEAAEKMVMEAGVRANGVKHMGRADHYLYNVQEPSLTQGRTTHIAIADELTIQFGTRPSGDELVGQAIGLDYTTIDLPGAVFTLDEILYLDQNNQQRQATAWRLSYAEGISRVS